MLHFQRTSWSALHPLNRSRKSPFEGGCKHAYRHVGKRKNSNIATHVLTESSMALSVGMKAPDFEVCPHNVHVQSSWGRHDCEGKKLCLQNAFAILLICAHLWNLRQLATVLHSLQDSYCTVVTCTRLGYICTLVCACLCECAVENVCACAYAVEKTPS
jgi:hypothetical protein